MPEGKHGLGSFAPSALPHYQCTEWLWKIVLLTWQHPGESQTYILHKDKTEHARTIFCVKLSIDNHIVGLVHKNHMVLIIRTRLIYHAACKVEFQPFTQSYSQLTFSYNVFFERFVEKDN